MPTLLPPPQRIVCSLMTSSSHSLSVSRHSRLHASRPDLTGLSLTTSLLRHCPGATSLRRARTASRTPLSKSPSPGGVTCSSLSSTSSCGSPSSPPLGSPVWSSHCPRSVWATRLPSHGLTLASHKGGSSYLSCSICWWTALPPLSVLPSLVSALWTRTRSVTCANFTRTTWSSLQAHLQHALDVVHAWGLRWRFSFGIGPTKSAVMVFGPLRGRPDCSVHLGSVSLPLVPQYRYLGVTLTPTLSWCPHVDLVCARGDRLFHQACAWCRGEGLSLSFSSSVFVTYVLSSSSFGLSVATPQHFNSTSRPSLVPSSSWVAQCFSCRSSSLGAWHWRCTPPCPRTCILFVWSLVCHGLLPLALQTLPVSSGSLRLCKAHGFALVRVRSSIPFSPASWPRWHFFRPSDVGSLAKPFPAWTATCTSGLQPWLPTCMACVSLSLLTTSSLPGRTRSTHNLPPSAVRLWGACLLGSRPLLHRPPLPPSAWAFLLPLLP